MYYHATAGGELLCTAYPLEVIDFRLEDDQSCIVHSNASSQTEAWQGRHCLLLRLTRRRLEQWLSIGIVSFAFVSRLDFFSWVLG